MSAPVAPSSLRCRSHAQGNCINGAKCKFVHEVESLDLKGFGVSDKKMQTPPTTTPIISPLPSSCSTNGAPNYAQHTARLPVDSLPYPSQAGSCAEGDKCENRHDAEFPSMVDQELRATTHAGKQHEATAPNAATSSARRVRIQMAVGQNQESIIGRTEQQPDGDAASAQSASATSTSRDVATDATRPRRGELPCFACQFGLCKKGERCRYSHAPELQEEARQKQTPTERRERDRAVRKTETWQRVVEEAALVRRVWVWQEAVSQMQGAEEVTARVAEEEAARHAEAARRAQEAIRHAHEEAALRAREAEEEAARVTREAEQVAARQAREAQREAVCRAREAEQQARQAAIIQKEAETTQTVISGSIVTFAAGLDIRTIVTGFESCTIRIEKLPANTQHDDVSALLTSYGVDSGRFHVVGVKMGSDGKKEAEVIADADCGRDLASWLDDDAYQLWRDRLKVEVSHNGTGGMGQPGESSGRDVEVLTISWHATSVAYIAEYEDIPQANRKVRDLDCRRCCGCIVEVQMNDGANGNHFVPQSIKIMNLPAIATDEDVARFAGTPNVRRLLGSDYSLRVGHDGFCVMLRDIVPKFEIEEFDGTPSKRGIISLHVRFMSSEDADKAHKALTGKRYFFLNNSYLSVKFRDRTI